MVLNKLLSKPNDKLGKPLRLWQAFPEFPEEVRRPAIFSLLFWGVLVVSYLFWALSYLFGGTAQNAGFVPVTLVAGVLVGVWLVLPWDSRVSRRRKLASPAFLVCVFAMSQLIGGLDIPGVVKSDVNWNLLFYPIACANGVFLFGFRRGIAYAAVTLAVITSDLLLSTWRYPSSEPSGVSIGNVIFVDVLFALVAVFVIGICAAIVEANRRREETEYLLGELKVANAELKEYTEKVRELAVSEERARMAREMHDSVGHHLTVVNVQLEAATKLMDQNPRKAREEVVKAKGLASEALSEVRRSVRALRPRAVEKRSVGGALSTLARDFEGAGPAVSFKVEGEERKLPADVELTLYRVLQEGLTNALKHSKARRISASLAFGEECVRLVVSDDGVGAPEDASERGFGLSALEDRARSLGGALRAGDAPDGGFALEVELPVRLS